MFAADQVRRVALNWLSIQYHELCSAAGGGGERDLGPPTFFAGHVRVLLQFQALQVEGVAVVPERHPRPPSQGVGALAGVAPLVGHGLVWQKENRARTKLLLYCKWMVEK